MSNSSRLNSYHIASYSYITKYIILTISNFVQMLKIWKVTSTDISFSLSFLFLYGIDEKMDENSKHL